MPSWSRERTLISRPPALPLLLLSEVAGWTVKSDHNTVRTSCTIIALTSAWYCANALPHGSVVKNLPANAGYARYSGSIPGSGRPPGEGTSTTVFLMGKSYGQGSLAGYSPWGHKELDMTKPLNLKIVLITQKKAKLVVAGYLLCSQMAEYFLLLSENSQMVLWSSQDYCSHHRDLEFVITNYTASKWQRPHS